MSDRVIDWNGQSYDLDPTELTMGEYEEIAKRGGPDGLYEMLDGLKGMKPTAWRSLFWIQDRRRTPDLSFGDYAGPTYRVVLDAQRKLAAEEPEESDEPEGEPGKAPSESDGSVSSPTSTGTRRKSSTG